MKRFIHGIVFGLITLSSAVNCFEITKVIVATDTNPLYIEFWPIVARMWKQMLGIRPTLAFIAPKGTPIDTSCGDVLYIEPIEGAPTSLQAQTIRLLLPALFKDEGCLLADIDAIPLQKEYFINSVKNIKDDCFALFRNGEYSNGSYPLWYNAAKGAVFGEIFHITNMEDIRATIKAWAQLGLGWNTDEILLYRCLNQWKYFKTRCILLGHKVERRVDRSNWKYSKKRLQAGYYIDSHLLRPYSQYEKEITQLIQDRGITLDILNN